MKKALVLVLSVVLIFSLAMPALAATLNIQRPVDDEGKSILVSNTAEEYQLVPTKQAWKLNKQEKNIFNDALKDLPNVVPQDTKTIYFFYLQVSQKCEAVFNINGSDVPTFKQYVDREWVELAYDVNKDGTVTVKDVVSAPMSITLPDFVTILHIQSPVGEDGLPLLITASAGKYQLVTIRDAEQLSAEEQQTFKDSLKDLPDAVPNGTNCRYFFYLQVSEKCAAVFNINGFDVPIFMQYVDGQWVELDYVVNDDGTVTVKDVVSAPMAICFLTNGDTDPLLISATANKCEIVITKDIEKLPDASQKALKDAFENLFDMLEKRNEEAKEDEQIRLRYFFYLSTNETCDAVFNVDAAEKPVFLQYLKGEWVELEYTANADNTVTVKSVQDAPMAICFPKQAAENK